MRFRLKHRSVLPGFGLTMGVTLFYLTLIVLLPLLALFTKTRELSWAEFWATVKDPFAVASYKLTLWTSLVAALINSFFGFIVAWTLVRYRFPGRKVVDALIDLPFALPTAVSGITLATVLNRDTGFIGKALAPLGISLAFNAWGIVIALVFIGLPFVVRTLEPAMEDLPGELEEAARSLGANPLQVFGRVILPALLPALLTGFALALARSLGEYGSVIFIAGNKPLLTQVTSQIIAIKLDGFDESGATAVALVMLAGSFVMLLAINLIQWRTARRYGKAS